MTRLSGPRRPAISGRDRQLIVFLHGYGADGNDLMGLAEPLAPIFPFAGFLAPHAPHPVPGMPGGRRWFPIPRLDGESAQAAAAGLAAARADLDAFLDDQAAEVPAAATVVIGFSQGTMLALHTLLRRTQPVAGIVGFSGALLNPAELIPTVTPEVLLVHGDADPMVAPESMPTAARELRRHGLQVSTHTSRGLGHGIAPDGLAQAVEFLRRVLPAA
ncbi:MAG: alpha/beta hydrolase [Arachnia sp.]